jgi:hypothetical protein
MVLPMVMTNNPTVVHPSRPRRLLHLQRPLDDLRFDLPRRPLDDLRPFLHQCLPPVLRQCLRPLQRWLQHDHSYPTVLHFASECIGREATFGRRNLTNDNGVSNAPLVQSLQSPAGGKAAGIPTTMTVRIAEIRINCGFKIATGGEARVEIRTLRLCEARSFQARINLRFATRTCAWSVPTTFISICDRVIIVK